MQAAKDQVSLRIYAGSPDPSLLAYAIVSKSNERVRRQITLDKSLFTSEV